MSLFDVIERKYGARDGGSIRPKRSESQSRDVKDLKEPRPTRAELRVLAGDEWDEIKDDPRQLATFGDLLMIQRMRSNGIAPDHYSSTTSCRQCGPVPIWEGCPPQVMGCPWCFNRLKGLPIPGAK